jgi:chromosomal replication initiator protein
MNGYLYAGLPKFVQQSMVLRVPIGSAKQLTDINTFKRFICEAKGIQHSALVSQSRKRHLVEARQWVMYYYVQHQKDTRQQVLTLSAIGDAFNKDHATVLHSLKAVANLLATDKFKRDEFEQLFFRIKTEHSA